MALSAVGLPLAVPLPPTHSHFESETPEQPKGSAMSVSFCPSSPA